MAGTPRPSKAAIVRTLVANQWPSRLHNLDLSAPMNIWHAVEPSGDLLLLLADQDVDRLAAASQVSDPAVGVEFMELPKLPVRSTWDSAWLVGWIEPVDPAEQREAAIEFSRSYPLGLLLDVGRGYTILRLDVAEVWLEKEDLRCPVDVDDYRVAQPISLPQWTTETVVY